MVNNRTLTRTEWFGPTPAPPPEIADGIVNLQAQYGIDADNDCQISNVEWTNAPPVLPVADWGQLLAVRIAVLVRGRQFERSGDPSGTGAAPVTLNPPVWAGGPFTMTNVDGTPDTGPGPPNPNNWRYYRYRVYERVIPLRNMIWGKCP